MPIENRPPKDLKSGWTVPSIMDGHGSHGGLITADAKTVSTVFGPESTFPLQCGICHRTHDISLPAFRLVAVQRSV